MKEIKFISLFAGVGGFDYGLQKAGGGFHKGLQQSNDFEETQSKRNKKSWSDSSNTNRKPRTQGRSKPTFSCVWANEWDKYASQIYQKRFPKTNFHEGDIRLVKANDIPEAELLVGGFPCQPFSIAGKRKGFEETRGTLFYEICRIARDKRIPFLLLENVKGLLSAQDGYAFTEILNTLDELGYNCQWQVLNSKNFGVPQNRERVFIIANIREKGFKQIFPIRQNGEEFNNRQSYISSCLDGNYHKGSSQGFGGKARQLIKEGENGMIELTDGANQANRIYSPEGLSKTLAGSAGGVGAKTGLYAVSSVAWRTRNYINQPGHFEIRKDNLANQLTTVQKDSMVLKGKNKIRRLTPIECERLQGFPDNWTKELSDTQRYKCMGNAVTVNVIEAIAKQMIKKGPFE